LWRVFVQFFGFRKSAPANTRSPALVADLLFLETGLAQLQDAAPRTHQTASGSSRPIEAEAIGAASPGEETDTQMVRLLDVV
jgi:hypothetical protein